MLTSDYLKEISKLRLDDDSPFLRAVSLIAATGSHFFDALKESGSQAGINRRSALRKSVKAATNETDVYELHDSSLALQRQLQSMPSVSGDLGSELDSKITEFKAAYREFLGAQDDQSAAALSWVAMNLHHELNALRRAWDHMLDSLQESESHIPADYEVLEFQASNDLSAIEFGKVISRIEALYSVASEFVGTNPRDFPLLVVRIESGSLLAKLAGKLEAIGATRAALAVAAANSVWMYSSRAGRIQIETRQMMDLLGLRNELEKSGISVAAMDSDLASIGARLTQKASVLINQLDDIRVDGEPLPRSQGFNLSSTVAQIELQPSQRLLRDEKSGKAPGDVDDGHEPSTED